jgi:hypothetical protein
MNSITWWSWPTASYFLNSGESCGFSTSLLDRHQAFLARLLQHVVEQRHQLHVARLGVLAALEALGEPRHGRLEHLRLVVGDERADGRAHDGDISNGSAFRMTPMLPPCTMYTPKMQPSATSQPTMTNMMEWGSGGGVCASYRRPRRPLEPSGPPGKRKTRPGGTRAASKAHLTVPGGDKQEISA